MSEKEELLELYKIHIEMIDRISQRRGVSNQFYTSVISALLGIITFSIDKIKEYKLICTSIALLGFFICIIWIASIHSYKQLNSAKFKVLYKIEEKLVFQFYREEWFILKNNNKYETLTYWEKLSPIVLVIPFIIIFIWGVFK
jgi:hypothetical protein